MRRNTISCKTTADWRTRSSTMCTVRLCHSRRSPRHPEAFERAGPGRRLAIDPATEGGAASRTYASTNPRCMSASRRTCPSKHALRIERRHLFRSYSHDVPTGYHDKRHDALGARPRLGRAHNVLCRLLQNRVALTVHTHEHTTDRTTPIARLVVPFPP